MKSQFKLLIIFTVFTILVSQTTAIDILTDRLASQTSSLYEGKIAFVSNRDDGNNEIYVMNADGSNQKRLTYNSGNDISPSWSPDGSKISFSSDRGGNVDIYVMDADGSHQIRLTSNPEIEGYPAWSPDGSKIYFTFNMPPPWTNDISEIYVMNADGSNQTQLTSNSFSDKDPTCSPDGSKIAFFSSRGGDNNGIYVMNADGSNQTLIASQSRDPSWSTDGSKIAYLNWTSPYPGIYVMNPDGSDRVQLTYGGGNDANPAWSPDGSKIAYDHNLEGNLEIYMMNTDGSNQTRLTYIEGHDFSSSWSRGPPITVLAPNGGEVWQLGSTQSISWSYAGDVGPSVKIEALKGTNVLATIVTTLIGSDGSGSYNLTIPSNTPIGTDYKIKITSTANSAYTDVSDAAFTITPDSSSSITIISPNGGEDYLLGSQLTIRWNYNGNPGETVKIELLKGLTSIGSINTNIGSSGTGLISYIVPSNLVPGIDYKIRITSTSNPACSDMSDSPFTISSMVYFGEWDDSYGPNMIYQAVTDGFICFYGGSGPVKGYTGLDPALMNLRMTGGGTMPVRKGDYWKVICDVSGGNPPATISWIPLITSSK